jgi:tetratricopeptide (TPR) repeat protein
MRYLSLFIVRLSTALLAVFLTAAGVHAQSASSNAWTVADLNAAVDAATNAASGVDSRYRLRVLLELAAALQNGAAPSRAPEIIQGAAAAIAADPTRSLSGGIGRPFAAGRDVVEELAQFGELQAAEALVGTAGQSTSRAVLLGSLGVGRAKAGDIAGAENAVAEIRSLATRDGASGTKIPGSVMARIGAALATSGAPSAAAGLAGSLPDGSAKANILAQSAFAFCAPKGGPAADPERGRELARQAGEMAKAAVRPAAITRQQRTMIALASVARARCDGPDAARAFVRELLPPEQVYLTMGLIADQLTAKGDFDLARDFTVASDLTDPKSLVDAAKRYLNQHDKDAARAAALHAAEQIQAATQRSKSDHFKVLGEIFGILVEVGEYDRAVAVAGSEEPTRKETLFNSAVERAIRRGDNAAVAHLTPVAIDAIMQPRPGWGSVLKLYWLTRSLAAAGYLDDARKAYQQLTDAFEHDSLSVDPVLLAELQALMGDIPAAVATADRAGLPPADPGRKARALQAITVLLAGQGNIDGALQVEAKLEAEPANALRDRALLSIAAAQTKSGDLRGAYSTSLRISNPYGRIQSLLRLVAVSPRQ